MARAIEFDTKAAAESRNHQEAVDRGSGKPGDVTQEWWPLGLSTVDTWCLWIGNDVVPDPVVDRTPAS